MKKDKIIIAAIGVVAVGLIAFYFKDKKTTPIARVTPTRQGGRTTV
jgi:hypothetical protein